MPSALNQRLPVDSPNHPSDWKYNKPFSGLQSEIYEHDEITLIEDLITKKEWIEEEDNDLLVMVGRKHNHLNN